MFSPSNTFEMSRVCKSKKSTSRPTAGGVGQRGFSVFAESESESEFVASAAPLSLAERFAATVRADPVLLALTESARGGSQQLWGDICFPAGSTSVDVAARPFTPPPSVERPLLTEDNLWAQPWAYALESHRSDVYDCSALSEAEWSAMMSWLYAVGWEVASESRTSVTAYPDNQPARVWLPPSRFELAAAHTQNHVVKVKAKKTGATVPKFCRNGTACTEAGCNWVHGDTIPVQDKVCGFDGRCSGEKRATCCFLHPSEGEIWSETLVRHRPTAETVSAEIIAARAEAAVAAKWAAIEEEINAESQARIDEYFANLEVALDVDLI